MAWPWEVWFKVRGLDGLARRDEMPVFRGKCVYLLVHDAPLLRELCITFTRRRTE